MRQYEFSAYVIVEARDEAAAKEIARGLDGITLSGGDAGLSLDESEPVVVDDFDEDEDV